MQSYDTVVDALNGLKARGYTTDFNIAFDKLICTDKKHILKPDEFEIVETYRFEGETNPSDEDVVYAIESKDGNIKGVITSVLDCMLIVYLTEMIQKLSKHK